MRTPLAALLTVFAATAFAADPPGIPGRWALNRELSQDLTAKIKDSAGPGSMDGGPSWRTDSWLPWGIQGGEPERMGLREFLLATVPAFDNLEIERRADEIVTNHGETGSRIFHLSRVSSGASALSGEAVKRAARLEGQQLTLESKGKNGNLHETLTLEAKGAQLVYLLRFEQERLKAPLQVRLVYDRVVAPK